MYDLHVHSNFSIESRSSMEDMVLSAIEKNFKTIAFADRIDLNYTINKLNLSFRVEDYFKSINKVKYRYLKKVEVLSGLEIGMQSHLGDEYNKIINKYPFDFIIMSIHSINGKDIIMDNFLEDLSPQEAVYLYYEHIYQCVNLYNNYDILGIFDAIDRYLKDPNAIPDYRDYMPLIKDILSIIISNGKGLEINSSALRYGLGYFHPKKEILSLYRSLGGEIITIGSSANTPQALGSDYRLLEKALKELGFKYIYIYRDRKKVPIQIA